MICKILLITAHEPILKYKVLFFIELIRYLTKLNDIKLKTYQNLLFLPKKILIFALYSFAFPKP
ncbi:MAG: hypothetical protein EAZ97_13985 [Bacteroidetes bacterium]|nr:MAG: hypothetical protein EAZ97_13985 [Bacteroidota bacterium]